MQEKSKKAFTPIIIVLVATFSFGLGRLTKIEENKPALIIKNSQTFHTPQTAQISQVDASSGGGEGQAGQVKGIKAGQYVASKNGTKYYLPNCSGVNRIKEENKIWLATKEEAEARGLTPAANCPGI